MAPDYDHLTLMQKVEVFEHALEHTQGDDLAKILWYKSPSSEVGVTGKPSKHRPLVKAPADVQLVLDQSLSVNILDFFFFHKNIFDTKLTVDMNVLMLLNQSI